MKANSILKKVISKRTNFLSLITKQLKQKKPFTRTTYDEYEDIQVFVLYTEEELKERADKKRYGELKAELYKIKEDIEQETFGLIRDDFVEKKARAAQIVNELRVLEGKKPREVKIN